VVTGASRIPTAPRRIEYVRLCDIVPAIRNPKSHDLPALIHSVKSHGYADAAILDERTHRLVAGHGRTAALVAMKSYGDNVPDGIMLDEDGEWLVPVQRGWASIDDAHAEAFIIEHNHVSESGGWLEGMLVDMLHDVHVVEPELFADMSFGADELDDLFRRNDPARLDKDPDDPDEPFVDPGQDDTDDTSLDDVSTPREKRIVTCPCCFHEFVPGEDL